MIDKIKEYALWLWDWAKRIFGRSKIFFSNAMAILAAGWIELADPIAMFDWDSVIDKHYVVIGIGLAVQMLNMYFRTFAMSGPISFRKLPDVPELPPVIDEESNERSPKAS